MSDVRKQDMPKSLLERYKDQNRWCLYCEAEFCTEVTGDYYGGEEYKKYVRCRACKKEWNVIYTVSKIEEIG
jgi:hypothetical protein